MYNKKGLAQDVTLKGHLKYVSRNKPNRFPACVRYIRYVMYQMWQSPQLTVVPEIDWRAPRCPGPAPALGRCGHFETPACFRQNSQEAGNFLQIWLTAGATAGRRRQPPGRATSVATPPPVHTCVRGARRPCVGERRTHVGVEWLYYYLLAV